MRLRFLPLVIILTLSGLGLRINEMMTNQNKKLEITSMLSLINTASAKEELEEDNSAHAKTAKNQNEQAQKCRTSIKLNEEDQYSPAQLKLLKSLAKRRQEIENQEKLIVDHENIVKLTEKQVDNKITEIKIIRDEAKELLKKLEVKEDEKIGSLVKIYQTMKPKEAAKIFEQLDMEILIQVINRMKEAKSAPIIALMDADKARLLTRKLASETYRPKFCNYNLDNF
jgi:flagellar motility protein MotE (MotC chaperone)